MAEGPCHVLGWCQHVFQHFLSGAYLHFRHLSRRFSYDQKSKWKMQPHTTYFLVLDGQLLTLRAMDVSSPVGPKRGSLFPAADCFLNIYFSLTNISAIANTHSASLLQLPSVGEDDQRASSVFPTDQKNHTNRSHMTRA